MNIIVCVKAVPGYVTELQVAENQNTVNYEADSIVINEADDYALEEALALKEQLGGEVTAITAGPLSSLHALYVALAKGADRAIRVDADFSSSGSIPRILAEAIKSVDYDLVLTGMESSDNMAAQVGVSIAVRLGLTFACAVTKVEPEVSSGKVTVTREMEGGLKQVLEMPLPALLCIEPGMLPLSYVAINRLSRARTKPITPFNADDPGVGEREIQEDRRLRITSVFPPQRRYQLETVSGNPSEVARVLVAKIKEVS